MKLYFTFFIILIGFGLSTAQSIFNVDLLKKIHLAKEEKVNVLILVKQGTKLNTSAFSDIIFHYNAGNIYSITASIESIQKISKNPNIIRIESVSHKLQLMDDTSVVKNKIKDIKIGKVPLIQAYDGAGVIVGIIDSGIDFNHPDFKDTNGKTRIKYLWDMTKPVSVRTPTDFGYGQEWNNTEIDMGQCNHSDMIRFGHGTASAGIAAGNGLAINNFEGMAPKADLVVVAIDFNRSGFTMTDAVLYLLNKAQLLNKPLVINASLGDYSGSHDGTDLETQMINNLIANVPGRSMVASCGNGGNIPFHVGYTIINTDTNFTWISNSSSQISLSEYADTNDIKRVQYSVGVNNRAFKDLGSITFKPYNYALNTVKYDTIFHNNQRIGIVQSIASVNSFGVYELYIGIGADSLNYLWRIEHTGLGKIDSWNFDYVTAGLPTSIQYPKIVNYRKADTLQTIVSGFQCSDEVIAVANYINRNQYQDVNNITQIRSETPGKIAITSSIGPTRDNRVKPDIAATGNIILACGALDVIPNLITNAPQAVAYGGYHITAGGTSASSPVVAGFIALYLQKNPLATNRQIKQAILNCAYSDSFTTNNLPNYQWGYGKLDGFGAINCDYIPTNISAFSVEDGIKISPNPVIDEASILLKNNNEERKIKIYNASGQLIFTDTCYSDNYKFNTKQMLSGLYLLVIEEKVTITKIKIIVL